MSSRSGLDAMKEGFNSDALTNYLSEQDNIAAAYLFGSRAAGRATSVSDLDIALLLREDDPALRFDLRLRIADEIRILSGIETDVVVLNDSPCILTHQILKAGRLIYERDRRARIDFEVRAGKIYADLGPSRRFFKKALLMEIREDRFGGR